MLKRLFYVSGIILMLAVAYHFGYREAQAQSGSYFRILGSAGNSVYVAVGDNVYAADLTQGSWELGTPYLPPVPVSSLVFYNYITAITESGEGWRNRNYTSWESIGMLPSGTIAVQPETWSGMKERYR